MRLLISVLTILLGSACVLQDPSPIKTQVVTFPEGATVEFNGRPVGRAPAAVILPQDSNGKLTERSIVRAVPNTAQPTLIAQSRVFEPGSRTERVPNQIMIDLTLPDTNFTASSVSPQVIQPESSSKTNRATRPRPTDRGKPTQPVGLDRWNPGIY